MKMLLTLNAYNQLNKEEKNYVIELLKGNVPESVLNKSNKSKMTRRKKKC